MLGGIPAYWERINPEQSISQNIRQQLLTPDNLMQAAPRLLLQDFHPGVICHHTSLSHTAVPHQRGFPIIANGRCVVPLVRHTT